MIQVDSRTETSRLSRRDCLDLLGGVQLGRIVFSHRALPAIRPVNHLVDGDTVVVLAHDGAAIVPAGSGQVVVAYEADQIDLDTRTGWSVVVTGIASLVADRDRSREYRARLRPWIGPATTHVIQIQPAMITGTRTVATYSGLSGSVSVTLCRCRGSASG